MYQKKNSLSVNEIYALNKISYRGKGSCTAILDTGIYPHSDLKHQLRYFKDFVGNKTTPYDDNSHGTHVAGILAGNGFSSNGGICGVAPESDIIALKILDKNGSGDKSALLAACHWLLDNHKKYNINIVNISVGSETEDCNEEKNEITSALEALWNENISLVVSAGNNGPGPGTITFPGTCKNVITVGSDSRIITGRKSSAYSGEGPTKCNINKPDLIAPGTNIISCHNKYNGYTVKSGTSMSTPIASGAIALFLEKYPNASNSTIKKALTDSATNLGLPLSKQGAGLLNIIKLLN